MDTDSFKEERDIDKSAIFIPHHAVIRFQYHIRKNLNYFKKMPDQRRDKCVGFNPSAIPKDMEHYRELLKELLNKASHENAVSRLKRTASVFEYRRNVFFFRCGRWQFRVVYDKEKNGFVLVTVIWLDERSYSLCFR